MMLRTSLFLNQNSSFKLNRLFTNRLRSIKIQTCTFLTSQPKSSFQTSSFLNQDETSTIYANKPQTENEEEINEEKVYFSKEMLDLAGKLRSQHRIGEIRHKAPSANRNYFTMHFKQMLLPFLHACINSGNTIHAFNTVKYYNYKNNLFENSDPQTIRDICYVLVKGYALESRSEEIPEIFRIMQFFHVTQDLRLYSWYLYSLAINNEMQEFARVIDEIESQDLILQDLFCESNLNKNQRELIKSKISTIKPGVVFNYQTIDLNSDCELTKTLYESQRTEYLPLISFNYETFKNDFQQQLAIEINGNISIKSAYKFEKSEESQFYSEKINELKKHWKNVLNKRIDYHLNLMQKKFLLARGMNLFPYLRTISKEKLVDIMIEETMSLCQNSGVYSPPSIFVYVNMGRKLQHQYINNQILSNFPETLFLYKQFLNYYSDPKLIGKFNPRQYYLLLAQQNEHYLSSDIGDMVWPFNIVLSIGKTMFQIIMSELKIDANLFRPNTDKQRLLPVVFTIYNQKKNKVQEEIKCDNIFIRLFQEAKINTLTFDPIMLPMIVPPTPWRSPKNGGYLMCNADFIRENNNEMSICKNRLNNQNLNVIFDSLNALSMCPWKVNQPILDIMTTIFNDKGNKKLNIPIHQDALPVIPTLKGNENPETKASIIKNQYDQKKFNSEMYALWCEFLYKLSIANHYRDKILWLPHNIDFRGRTYPIPPYLHHLGGDTSRALLVFAQAKPLGPKGFRWLKIHLVNLTGLLKRKTLDEREQFADENMDNIIDSAENPLDGKLWWQKSDDPWQTLACCMEIRNIIKSGVPPEEYLSSFPVHQDGSCNGLQHYAALGRDLFGAKSVNLVPHDKPNDVYSDVAVLVEEKRKEDASNGNKIAQLLEGAIERKVVKTTVMTYVYGVTSFGAKGQFLKNLKDYERLEGEYFKAALYLTEHTFKAIFKMFTSTKKIQDWFTLIAMIVSKHVEQPVEWITPLGLPVVQPYFKEQQLATTFKFNPLPKVNSLKQKNGFPPNYIHSLDSSHMMLTSLFCENQGLTFVSVHDSFWTHPCDIDVMNMHCRQQFVNLHSCNLLQNLSDHLVKLYSNAKVDVDAGRDIFFEFKNVPKRGEFEIQDVLHSTYFFS